MFTKLKKRLLNHLAVITLGFTLLVPATAIAASCQNTNNVTQDCVNTGLCAGSNLNLSGPGTSPKCDENSAEGLTGVLRNIINIFSIIVGVVAVIMIIVGGFRYITSGGASEKVSGAKNTLIYAVVGLVIVALAQFVVHFVLGQTASATG